MGEVADAASPAGAIAEWAFDQLGANLFGTGFTSALTFLGLDGGSDVDTQLAAMNAKLDQILSKLDVIGAQLTNLSAQVDELLQDLDIGLKQAYASIAEQWLLTPYGFIDRKFGSRSTANSSNLYGLMHLPPTGKRGVKDDLDAFIALRPDLWNAIEQISDRLTVSPGSSDPLISQWATLVQAQAHARGPGASIDTCAGVFEGWFTDAVSHQLKAFAMILFTIGSDQAAQARARARFGAILRTECDLYVSGMERLALVWARTAPSGPGRWMETVVWPRGSALWLLRADVLARVLVGSVGARNSQWPIGRTLSGGYGRILMRPSSLDAAGRAPDRIAMTPPSEPQASWPLTGTPAQATLGPLTEFQGIDWAGSKDGYAALKPGPSSRLRFARYYWPMPAGYRGGEYSGSPLQFLAQSCRASVTYHGGPPGNPNPTFGAGCKIDPPLIRPDARYILYSLTDLAPISTAHDLTFDTPTVFFPSEHTWKINGKTVLVVISLLDGWSSVSGGATFDTASPSAFQLSPLTHRIEFRKYYTEYPDDVSYSNDAVTISRATDHPLAARPDQERLAAEALYKPDVFGTLVYTGSRKLEDQPPSLYPRQDDFLTLTTSLVISWPQYPYRNSTRYCDRTLDVKLFKTAASERGSVLLYLKGKLSIRRANAQDGVQLATGVRIWIVDSTGAVNTQVFDSTSVFSIVGSNASGDAVVLANYVPIQLQPNVTYGLRVGWSTSGGFDYDQTRPNFHGPASFTDNIRLSISDLGVVRPAGTGYSVTG
jgi:hypothetical protein